MSRQWGLSAYYFRRTFAKAYMTTGQISPCVMAEPMAALGISKNKWSPRVSPRTAKRHQSLASPFVFIRAESRRERTWDTGHGDKGMALGLKPSWSSVVPGDSGILFDCFPTVETVGFLLPSREAGLDGRQCGLN